MTHAHAPWPSVAINTGFCDSTGGHWEESERGRGEDEGNIRDEGAKKKKEERWGRERAVGGRQRCGESISTKGRG